MTAMDGHLGARLSADAGRLRLHGGAATLARWFDDEFRDMAMAGGALECRFPVTLARRTLERAGYFQAFPGGASAAGADCTDLGFFLNPAVCYHAYAWLEDARLSEPAIFTAAQSCFREADRAAETASRLWEFTMREVIFAGSPQWIEARADEWAHAIEDFATSLGLDAAIEPATDSFIGPAARGQRLIQQLKGLKRELTLSIEDARVAAASINLHETHFSSRFGFRLAGGGAAHSACVAFGIERWTLAFLAQRGTAAAAALIETRRAAGR
jgi:seryl-tRNA synthetase